MKTKEEVEQFVREMAADGYDVWIVPPEAQSELCDVNDEDGMHSWQLMCPYCLGYWEE